MWQQNCGCAWWYCIGTLRRSADVYLYLFNISFKRLNHCDDLQSSFSSECRITHQILSVFTSIFKAVLNFLGGIHQALLKCKISPCCLDTLPPSCFPRFFRAPSASIQPVNETQLDHFSPRQASSSNYGLWQLLYLCQEVYFRPRWRAAAEPQLSECWGESWVMLFQYCGNRWGKSLWGPLQTTFQISLPRPVSLEIQRENPFRKEIRLVRRKMTGSDYSNSLLSVMQI